MGITKFDKQGRIQAYIWIRFGILIINHYVTM